MARRARSAPRTSPRSARRTAPSTTTGSRSTSMQLGPLVAKPSNPDNVVAIEEVAGTPIAQVCIGSSVNSGYADLALPGRDPRRPRRPDRPSGHLGDRDAGLASDPRGDRRIGRVPAALGRRRADARARVRSVRGHGPGAAVGLELAAHVQSQLPRAGPGRPEDSVFLCSPAVAAVSLLSGKIEDPREYGEPPELLPMPELRPYLDDVHIFAPADEGEAERIEIPRGPNIKRPPEHKPARRLARGEDRDRPAGQHLDRRPRPRRRRGDVLPLERAGDRGVHAAPPRSRVPQTPQGVGEGLHRRRRTTTARAPRASTPRWRRCTSASRRYSPSRSRASTAATWSRRGSWR